MSKSENASRFVAYTRVSTASQADSGIGLDGQRHAIEAAALMQGLTVTGWHEDAGKSGARMTNRPGLQAALQDLASGRADGLIVSKVDRLGRSSGDVCSLVERCQRNGWRLVALDCGLDLGTPAGEMVAAALAMAARFEYRRISERQVEKNAELRRRGRPRAGVTVGRDLADRIIAMRERGGTWQAIGEALDAEGIPTARGGQRWYPATVRSAHETRRLEVEAQASA